MGAMSFIPASSPFWRGLKELRQYHKDEPVDWRQGAWYKLQRNYMKFEGKGDNEFAKFNAVINGLMGALAFLYGEGDFTKTVGIATAAGYDADNQPATIGGALGVMYGSKKIPRHFTHDINGNHWSRPFNDKYVNERRDNLPRESSITDIVNRIKRITVKAILAGGGKETGWGSNKKYQVKVSKELSCPNTCV